MSVDTDQDEALERRIDAAFQEIVTAVTRDARIRACEKLRALIRQRTPARIERMERERGLR